MKATSRKQRAFLVGLSLCLLVPISGVANAQINMIHQEGFNDDGDGTRYTMLGRGQEVLDVGGGGARGGGRWEHSFNVDVIGLPAIAPAKRAAILWHSGAIELEEDFSEDALMIWDNLINYMIDDQPAQTIGFFPNNTSPTADFLTLRLEDAGHTVLGLDVVPADPSEVNLIIQSEEANPAPGTLFATFDGTGYPVPVITYNGGNHDDTLISSIGAGTSTGITQVSVVEDNQDHPILGGKTGDLNWLVDFFADQSLQGIGASTPAGSKTLITYEDGGVTLPGLVVVEEGDPLLGAFAPVPEGEGFIIGGDMNERFPDEAGEFTDAAMPRVVQLNPVDISGETGVKVSVALAATDVDFESPDFLKVAYTDDPEAFPEDFITLAQFDGMAPGVLIHPDLGPLSPNEFTDFTFEIPDDVDNLILRFEAFSTFPNEVLGIDNVRIFTGEPEPEPVGIPGDVDGNGSVEFADFLVLSNTFGQTVDAGTGADIDGDGEVAFADFLLLSANFGQTAGASAVPEPSAISLLLLPLACLGLARRRRR